MAKSVVVFSGGPDSTAAALWAVGQSLDPELLSFEFKQREQRGEIYAAMRIAHLLGFKHEIIDFKSPMLAFSTDVHVLMHAGTTNVQDKSKSHRMEFGAGIILSTASAYAVYNQIDHVVWGATKDDAIGGRFEYTQDFANGLASLVAKTIGRPFTIHVPFANDSKHRVLACFKGKEDLFSTTWSCKAGGMVQCGTCHACVARRVAAQGANVPDHTAYHSANYVKPINDAQIADLESMTEVQRAKLFESEKPPI